MPGLVHSRLTSFGSANLNSLRERSPPPPGTPMTRRAIPPSGVPASPRRRAGESVGRGPEAGPSGDGGFHGWGAVEASMKQTAPAQGTSPDDIGVFEISEF
jgi:hypothetical protein